MFGWFTPRCPLVTWEKTWTEMRMCWLVEQLGLHRLLEAQVILPTKEHFPDNYQGSLADAQRIMELMCRVMGIDPTGLELQICPDEEMPEAAGLYIQRVQQQKSLIRVAQSQVCATRRPIVTKE